MAQQWEDEPVDTPWREWLTARFRAWAGFMLGVLAVAAIAGVSLVGATGAQEEPEELVEDPAPIVLQQENDLEDDGDKAGHAVENHGRCVSRWAKEANEAGLKGPARGAFMSTVAEDEGAVADKSGEGEACDFAQELETALEAQAEWEAERGKPATAGKAKGSGKPEHAGVGKGPKGGDDQPEGEEG